MSSTSSERASTSTSHRGHNEGRQDRSFTPAQKAAVNRVRKCKHTDYYAILDIESPSSDSEIRKAYRKLALIMHPDKNGAPGADEAFKLVSKAFQVLSDPNKKTVYDQTGSDPESRPGVSSRASSAGAGPGGSPFGDISPDDLFNMFFGGGMQGGGGGMQFGGFGGPGIRVHTFGGGGGGSPFASFANQGPRGAAGTRQRQQPAEPFSLRQLLELLPLMLLFFVPMLFSLFGDSSSARTPQFKFSPVPPYTVERHTPTHNIPYFVKEADVSRLSPSKLHHLGKSAENSYIQIVKNDCYQEYERKEQKISDAQGWFFVDVAAYDEAMRIPLPSCDRLEQMGVTLRR